MSDVLAQGDAFREADDLAEEYRAKNARVRKAHLAQEAEEKAHADRLQADMRAAFYARNPHLRKDAA